MPCQRRNRKGRASKWNSSKIHCSILLHALLPQNARETCEGVGWSGKSWEREAK